jgi:DNA-binding HxlR family transcriptional regulator
MPTMTAVQKREAERQRHDAWLKACPTSRLLEAVSGRWVSLIVCSLGKEAGPLRYNELSRRIPSASQKMLTQTVRALERDGILVRTATLDVPVRVEYELTDLGRNLYGLLQGVREWAEANIGEVERARARYDAR